MIRTAREDGHALDLKPIPGATRHWGEYHVPTLRTIACRQNTTDASICPRTIAAHSSHPMSCIGISFGGTICLHRVCLDSLGHCSSMSRRKALLGRGGCRLWRVLDPPYISTGGCLSGDLFQFHDRGSAVILLRGNLVVNPDFRSL